MYKGIAFSPVTVLAQVVGEADTIIRVGDSSVFPAAPNYATIDDCETILYSQIADGLLSGCTRGVEGVAVAHTAGSKIARLFTSEDYNKLVENISDIVIPTKVSELENDSGFALETSVPTKVSQLVNDSDYATNASVATRLPFVSWSSGNIVGDFERVFCKLSTGVYKIAGKSNGSNAVGAFEYTVFLGYGSGSYSVEITETKAGDSTLSTPEFNLQISHLIHGTWILKMMWNNRSTGETSTNIVDINIIPMSPKYTIFLNPTDVIVNPWVDVREYYNPVATTSPLSIPTALFTADNTYTDYPFRAKIPQVGLTSSDSVNVNFDVASVTLANTSGIASVTVSAANEFYLYSKAKPTAALNGSISIVKGGA